MLTYNHEAYIKEAIESILMQKVNFKIEVLIANDCSTDKTAEIINNIKYNHSNGSVIIHIDRKVNLGMQYNFLEIIKKARGQYIAMCEGDDYWTDTLKLKKQVDFLEAHKDHTICFHKVQVLENNTLANCEITESRYNNITERPINLKHLLENGNFIHTPSVVFRNLIKEFPFEFTHSTVGDYFLYILLAKKGFIKRLDEVMAVYRRGVGVYSTLSSDEMQKQVLIYQACILSNLEDPEHKKILLAKHIYLIKEIIAKEQFQNSTISSFKLYQLIKLRAANFFKRKLRIS